MAESWTRAGCVLRAAARAALLLSLCAGSASTGFANSDGVIGASGKNSGFYCRNCHAGGTVPTVAFEGPTVMGPGAIATFKFTVKSHSDAQVVAGLDVAASGGVLGLVEGQGTRLQLNEVTHSRPKENDPNGEAVFQLTWRAPTAPGTYTLFGAATSANGNGERSGDAAARTTHAIVVGDNIPTPTPTSTPSPPRCPGDCDASGEVTVDEIITGVNVALGFVPLPSCPVFDHDGDGAVTVDEILRAVNSALNGCRGERGAVDPEGSWSRGVRGSLHRALRTDGQNQVGQP